MEKNKTQEYKFWNGKNVNGQSTVGDTDLLPEGARANKTLSKYDVSNDTTAASDLQTK